ncbi:uncharacterized protein LOC125235277 [Leguminivora glycinivorella]|uniref:uncharacterized protein LOC125235277 n=1 Tax=Leguminivora glycinivorella TaxID=1035111 RepID=UPI00200E18A5|nr:uncharacterized protein LOC125235277 [Leguminivora glycinivorella]XP_047997743.1 uncharacterized protein LOC125235277 [Leguminivora glycinivorella]
MAMQREAPEFKRCCFCIPLRRGLIAWGYVKLILDLLVLAYLSLMFFWLAHYGLRFVSVYMLTYIFIAVCSFLDTAFSIVFIVAGHKKSIKLLKVSYVYNIVWLGFLVLGNSFTLYTDLKFLYKMWSYMKDHKYIVLEILASSALATSTVFIQIYVILLIRSEISKLQNQTLEMQFTNHVAAEPLCTLRNESDCTEKKLHGEEKGKIDI